MKYTTLEEHIIELTKRIKDEKEYLAVLTGSTVLDKIKEECETNIKALKANLRFAVNKLRRYDELDFYEQNKYKLEGLPEEGEEFESKNYPYVDDGILPFDIITNRQKKSA